jgi:hypothetical protein
MTTALEKGEKSASRPGRSLYPGKTRYPLYRRLGGSQGRSGQVRKMGWWWWGGGGGGGVVVVGWWWWCGGGGGVG